MKSLAFIFLLATMLVACSTNSPNDCSPTPPDGTGSLTFVNGSEGYSTTVKYWDAQNFNNQYSFASSNVNLPFISNLLTPLIAAKVNSFDNRIVTVAIYLDKPVSKETSFSMQNVKAVSVFESKELHLYHHLFIKENEVFQEDLNYFIEVPCVTSNQPIYNLCNVVFPGRTNTAFVLIPGPSSYYWYPSEQSLSLPLKFGKKYTKEPVGCGSPCNYGNEDQYCIYYVLTNSYECSWDGGPLDPCATDQMILVLGNQSIASNFNPANIRSFRDSFLVNSTMGQRYITSYYYMSEILVDNISFDLALKTAQTMPTVNRIMSLLMQPNGHLNDIVVTASDVADIEDLLDEFYALSSDTEYLSMIDAMRDDLDDFTGLTLSQVLALISNHQ